MTFNTITIIEILKEVALSFEADEDYAKKLAERIERKLKKIEEKSKKNQSSSEEEASLEEQ